MILRSRSVTYRYRVAEVHVFQSSETAFVSTPREFRTLQKAQAYQDKLTKKVNGPVLLQVGVLIWGPSDEAIELMQQTFENGASIE